MIVELKILLGITFAMFCLSSCNTREKDYSLSLDEYEKLGMPIPNQPWSSDDFLNANDVLGKFKWENPGQLPKKGSEKSGALFGWLISLENLTFLNVDTLKLNEKALLLMNYLQIYENWRYIYTDVRLKVQYHHRELIDIQLFGLSIIDLMLDYADKIQKSDDPEDVYMRSGDRSIREMYIGYILVTLKIQEDTTPYTKEDLERVADSISTSIERNKDWMDSIATNLLKQSMETVMDSTSSDYIKNKYRILSDLL